MKLLFSLVACALLLNVLGCARRPVSAFQPVAVAAPAPAPQLLFLSGQLTAGATGTQLQVLQARAVAGDLKMPEADADTPDFLRVSQLDGRGRPLVAQRLPHPLRRSVEHVGDDLRTFKRSEVRVPTADFFVRLALRPAAAAIRVEEVADGKTTLLTEFPVPPKS